jgi:hypothetical protein
VLRETTRELVVVKDLVGELRQVKVTKVKKQDQVGARLRDSKVGKCRSIEDFLREVSQMQCFKKEYAVLNLSNIAEKFDGDVVNREIFWLKVY